MIIKDALDAYATTVNRAFEGDRQQTIGASEIGQCARKLFYSKYEGDRTYGQARNDDYDDGWGARLRGTFYENYFWEPALKTRHNGRFILSGPAQQTFVSGFLSATPDGLIVGGYGKTTKHKAEDDCFAVECKTIDPRVNLSEAKPEHVLQAQVQLGLIREQTDYKPSYSIISYTNASFWDDIKEFKIPFDSNVFDAAKARASRIMNSDKASDLPPEGWIAGGKECGMCPFTKACGIERTNVPYATEKAVEPAFAFEAEVLARYIKKMEEESDRLQVKARQLQEDLKTRMRHWGYRKIEGDGFKVSWSSVKGRTVMDNKQLQEAAEEAGIDLDQFRRTGEPSDRLTISITPNTVEKPDPSAWMDWPAATDKSGPTETENENQTT